MAYRQTPAVEARLQDNRSRILDAARALVSEGGWAQTQVASVAATAGVATGTVYRHFSSKAELFAEVLAAVSRREVEVVAAIAHSEGPADARLHAAVQTFVRRAMRNPRLAYALIAEPCDREIDEARLTYRAAVSEAVRLIVESGQDAQEFRPDVQADIAATVIVGGFMEALIGPLSPLAKPPVAIDTNRDEVARLADQIALLACASVVPVARTTKPHQRRRP